MDAEERLQAASKFLLQSPPGEINDVLNDVRNIISDDESLQAGVLPALREYNLAQFMTADVPGHNHQSIISEAARVSRLSAEGEDEGEDEEIDRFWDPRSRTSFRFDHLSLETSEPEPVEPDAESEPFRVALEASLLTYLAAHFNDGVASVFSTPGSATRFCIQIVANKYNPSNYWSGRWRSEYVVDLEERKLTGKLLVNVHYYEQGNVQLETTHSVDLSLPPAITLDAGASSASKILALIEAEEGKYQTILNDMYADMSEKTFKGLRRALPMTRSKLDWDRVLGYKLGAELSSNKTVFGS
ncbi:F-actin capping protein, alpha subunit [Laetiporus sulphureus 93-53]|uniref:F-actin-capping protein subunit alpha n=1 Tax=Laetiporus sulphureus 93-53 TaxID=1314785 RepID=A0A165FQK9_9APHY|nr:F-actin capping protein, alpha subunit [Laetiporus sulphureus 93-53]KZT09326.1 F-actin capping protein, alpha subunit [Laetiporus sulphureus 93-53]